MRAQRHTWARKQAIAVAGLLVIVVFSSASALGWVAAEVAGLPPSLGWLVGSVAGYFLARTLLRRVLPPLLPPAP